MVKGMGCWPSAWSGLAGTKVVVWQRERADGGVRIWWAGDGGGPCTPKKSRATLSFRIYPPTRTPSFPPRSPGKRESSTEQVKTVRRPAENGAEASCGKVRSKIMPVVNGSMRRLRGRDTRGAAGWAVVRGRPSGRDAGSEQTSSTGFEW